MDVGRDLLPDARREQHVRRPDLAQVVHHRALVLGEIDPGARDQRHQRDVDLLDDPRQRQDRDVLVGRLARLGAQVGGDVLEQRPVLQHRELGMRGGARGRAQHRDLVAAAGRDRLREAPGRQPCAVRDQLLAAQEAAVRVFAHAARVVVDDPAQRRQLACNLEHLVGLLFVLDQHDLGLGVAQQVLHLARQRVLVDAERHRAHGVRRELRPQPVRPVAADDADHVAARDALRQQPERQLLDPLARIRPAVGVPDAVGLLAQRDLGAVLQGVVQQQLRGGVVARQIGRLHRHATLRSASTQPDRLARPGTALGAARAASRPGDAAGRPPALEPLFRPAPQAPRSSPRRCREARASALTLSYSGQRAARLAAGDRMAGARSAVRVC